MKTFSYSASIIIILLLISGFSILSAQTYTVKGEVTTTTGPVKFARVTFIDRNDTTKRFSASTDTSGNYKLDVITAVKPRNTLPVNFELEQNYPNPFSSQTSIPYKLNKQANISVKIYNILGQLVKEFKVGIQSAGIHGVIWDGKNNFGNRVTAGIYFYRLTTGNEGLTKKMLFGFGNSPRLQQPLGTVWYQDKKNGAKKFNLVQNTEFDVRVENSGNCTPKILPKEFTNIQIEKDTALNFDVELGIMAYSLCYQKGDSATINGHYYAHWDIYLNNITGTNSKDISNWIYDDDYNPVWSPDGKYIAFRADRNGLFGTRAHLYLYDTQNDTTINLSSDTVDCDLPMWTPDSKKIVYQYHVYRPDGTQWHIINFDGTGDHKLKYKPSFFYPDSYNYIYSDDSGRVYKTNIDNSINEFVVNKG